MIARALIVGTFVVGAFVASAMSQNTVLITPQDSVSIPVAVQEVQTGTSDAELILEVQRYTPPTHGAVEVVVSAPRDATQQKPLGSFGIFPNEPFLAASLRDRLKFQFRVSPVDAAAIAGTRSVEVRLRALTAAAPGAEVEIGTVVLEIPR